jgi:methyl-accepting chemotaxis protein
MHHLTRSLALVYLGLDLLFGPLVAFAYLQLLDPRNPAQSALVFGALLLCKIVACHAFIRASVHPFEVYQAAEHEKQRDSLVASADAALQRFPAQMAACYSGTWVVVLLGAYALLVLRGEFAALPPGSAGTSLFVTIAVTFGAAALAFPLAILLTSREAGECAIYARDRGILLSRSPIRIQSRIGVMSFCLALGPMFWMVAIGYWTQVIAVNEAVLSVAAGTTLEVTSSAGMAFLINAGIFGVLVCFWAPICALALSKAVSVPVERLTAATREIVAEGNQTNMRTLPMNCRDEVGVLSERFNDLLDMMRDLSRGADAIARGHLKVEMVRQGELPDAFRRMSASLNELVGQIRNTSVDLAAAATEILAASQEQEAASASQSSAMTEINHTMDSLSVSAAHVSESASVVLKNAEQTLVTTDTMVERIESLSAHTGRISELLDVIRDVADKSDLLALNGSLEASRAGENGQGFALVAAEMRRLAVRVTASVQDVKKLVSDIGDSSASTIMATEEGRKLARATTDAARSITLVSQQQRGGTEQVSQSVKGLTDVVTQAAAATSQTRTSAQGLKGHADTLSALVRRFEVAEERG